MLAYSQAQWAWVSFELWMGHISQGPGGPATGNFKQSVLCIPANLYVQNFLFSAFMKREFSFIYINKIHILTTIPNKLQLFVIV